MFGGGGFALEESADDFSKAANLLKMAKEWKQAGATYLRSADLHKQAGAPHEAASCYVNAAGCFRKCTADPDQEAIKCLRLAIEYYTDEGRFSMAAKYEKEIAEIYEAESNFEESMKAYQQSAELYEGENAQSSADQCILKVAQFAAQLERYDQAIEIYEKVASNCLDNNLRKYQAKDFFLRAGICRLCSGDSVGARRALERYQGMDYGFVQEREAKLLDALITAFEELDVEAFTSAIVDYDSISKLDSWKTTMLLRIKKQIKEQDDDLQ